ncbi:MAG: hypothetical protein DA408_18725 [Bacteroidetes bacterium]|nr:MAG: hypothetical protein DA408_18725 [Bacteroidota bacterium]
MVRNAFLLLATVWVVGVSLTGCQPSNAAEPEPLAANVSDLIGAWQITSVDLPELPASKFESQALFEKYQESRLNFRNTTRGKIKMDMVFGEKGVLVVTNMESIGKGTYYLEDGRLFTKLDDGSLEGYAISSFEKKKMVLQMDGETIGSSHIDITFEKTK